MWIDDPPKPNGTLCPSLAVDLMLSIAFESQHTYPIQFSTIVRTDYTRYLSEEHVQLSEQEQKKLTQIISRDTLDVLTDDEKEFVWRYRFHLRGNHKAIGKFLMSVNWTDLSKAEEARWMLSSWEALTAEDALELLSGKYADTFVREFAVLQLDQMSNELFQDYLPQLVQALKSEVWHYSPLACLLIRKALGDLRNAHCLFWHLRSELHYPYTERYQLLLEAFLLGCGGAFRRQLMHQDDIIGMLTTLAKETQQARPQERDAVFTREIARLPFSYDRISLPIAPSIPLARLLPKKCSYFESKTFPLFLTFENVKNEEFQVIFKLGDDLRQDGLVLHMFKLFDKLWKKEGLHLSMTHYRILATDSNSGLIEVVPNAQTIFDIQMEQGGATAAFKSHYLKNWMLNKTTSENRQYFISNFTRSLAAYCVATYVLGIGDRHNENIMLSNDGKLFHIDFGRILGHWEKFAGLSRDRVPFVFTKDFAHVIDYEKPKKSSWEKSEKLKEFIDISCKAFNRLRSNTDIFISLLSLVISSGILEFESIQDLEYLRFSLQPSLTEEEATQYFTDLIWKSMRSKAAQFNFFVHNVAHLGKSKKNSKSATQ